jgi:heme A synthase
VGLAVALSVLVGLPCWVGYRSARWAALLLPAAMVAAMAWWRSTTPDPPPWGGDTDPATLIAGAFTLFAGIGLAATCIAIVAGKLVRRSASASAGSA